MKPTKHQIDTLIQDSSPTPATMVHVAGEVDADGVQLCTRCPCELSESLQEGKWPVGAFVWVTRGGGRTSFIRSTEDADGATSIPCVSH